MRVYRRRPANAGQKTLQFFEMFPRPGQLFSALQIETAEKNRRRAGRIFPPRGGVAAHLCPCCGPVESVEPDARDPPPTTSQTPRPRRLRTDTEVRSGAPTRGHPPPNPKPTSYPTYVLLSNSRDRRRTHRIFPSVGGFVLQERTNPPTEYCLREKKVTLSQTLGQLGGAVRGHFVLRVGPWLRFRGERAGRYPQSGSHLPAPHK